MNNFIWYIRNTKPFKIRLIPIILLGILVFAFFLNFNLCNELILGNKKINTINSFQKTPDSSENAIWDDFGAEICTAEYTQDGYQLISDQAGGTIITWHDYRTGTTSDIYAQRINSIGTPQWTTNGVVICTAVNNQLNPQLVSDQAGGAIITWHDYRSGTTSDIYAQRINSTGDVQWTANGVVICTAVNNQEFPQLVSDQAGGGVITWQDYRTGSYSDIYAQRINSTGDVQWTTNGVAICTAIYSQNSPQIISDQTGGVIIGWLDSRSYVPWEDEFPDYGGPEVYVQRIDSTGIRQWTNNGVVLTSSPWREHSDKRYLHLVSDGSNGVIVIWQDWLGDYYPVYVQRLNSAGIKQWTSNGLIISTNLGNNYLPQLIGDDSGGAIITWYDTRNNYKNIITQRINSTGEAQWTANGVVICTAVNNQLNPQLVSDQAGGAIITWQDYRTGSYSDIFTQRINSNGAVQWTSTGVAICTAPGYQSYPRLISDGFEGSFIVWCDYRSGSYSDLYAQRIDSTGIIQWTSPDRPVTNHPSDIVTTTIGTENISWIITDALDPGQYCVLINDTLGNSYTWVNWTFWENNTNLNIAINRTVVGLYYYTLECYNNKSNFGKPDIIIVEVIPDLPIINHPNDIVTFTIGSEKIGWIITDALYPGQYRVLVNDSLENSYIWIDWTPWANNTNLNIVIDRSNVGVFEYTIEYYNIEFNFGIPDTVKIEVILDIPIVNHPDDLLTRTTGDEKINWIITDALDPGQYHVIVNDPLGDSYIWVDWTLWVNNTNLNIAINRSIIGVFVYTIEYYNIEFNYGTPDTVKVEVFEYCASQSPTESWNFTGGGVGNDKISAMAEYGGSYYIVNTAEMNSGNFDGIISKINAAGQLEWFQKWGDSGVDNASDIAVDDYYGYIYVTGSYFNVAHGDTDIFLARYDISGNKQWSLMIGGSGNDIGYRILSYGYYNLLIGGIDIGGQRDLFFMAFDPYGYTFPNFTIGWPGDDIVDGALFYNSGIFPYNSVYISGKTTYGLQTNTFVMRLIYDTSYHIIESHMWNKTWRGYYDNTVEDLCYFDNSLYLVGSEQLFEESKSNAYFMRLDLAGNQIWKQDIGISLGNYYANQILRYNDDYFYILGSTDYLSHGGFDAILMKYSGDGQIQWNFTWGGLRDEFGIDFTINNGACYIVGNVMTESNGSDGFMVKILIFDQPISINGNQALGVKVDRGSGSWIDPYIIENKIIDAGEDIGIYIQNTNMYLIIQDCVIFNTGAETDGTGIYIHSCGNVTIQQCYTTNCVYGFIFKNTTYSNIHNNTASKINLHSSDWNTISINNMTWFAAESSSEYNCLENNTISGEYTSVTLDTFSKYNIIKGNLIDSQMMIGYVCDYNIITENIIQGSIILYGCTNIQILKNNIIVIHTNTGDAIYIQYSFSGIITDNIMSTPELKTGSGITFKSSYGSQDFLIARNIITEFSVGIDLEDDVHTIQIINNTISNNTNGIFLGTCANTLISGNSILKNSINGIVVSSSAGGTIITGNSITNNTYYGVRILSSSGTTQVINNWIVNNGIAPFFDLYGVTYFWNNIYIDYAHHDEDHDGLTDQYEMDIGTSMSLADTDGDNFLDGYEIIHGTDPLDNSSYPPIFEENYAELLAYVNGNATLLLALEALINQNAVLLENLNLSTQADLTLLRTTMNELGISIGDTDYDGLDDLDELKYHTDPKCSDTDCDNLNDAFEVKFGTDPTNDDTDGDGALDGVEVIAGYDPLDALNYPGMPTTTLPTETSKPLSIVAIISIVIGGISIISASIVILTRKRRK